MDGYREAEKIDTFINKLVKVHSLTEDNALAWLCFTRTITTSLHILELEARKTLREMQTALPEVELNPETNELVETPTEGGEKNANANGAFEEAQK